MRTYRLGWLLGAGAIGAIGLALAVLAVPPVALVVVAAAGAGGGAMLLALLPRRPSLRNESVPAGSLGCLSLIGLLSALGWIGATLVGLLVVSALPLLGPLQAWSAARRPPGTPTSGGDPARAWEPVVRSEFQFDPPAVRGWSDEELCRAWRASSTRLQRAVGPSELASAAHVRRIYLDEIERRHPAHTPRG